MSGPLVPPPSDYDKAMKAWNLKVAAWLSLDPEQVFDLDVAERPFNDFGGKTVEVGWSATSALTPRLGYVHAPGMASDGEVITYSGHVSLDWQDGEAFWEAVGPKPVAPQETPEAQAVFARLRQEP